MISRILGREGAGDAATVGEARNAVDSEAQMAKSVARSIGRRSMVGNGSRFQGSGFEVGSGRAVVHALVASIRGADRRWFASPWSARIRIRVPTNSGASFLPHFVCLGCCALNLGCYAL